MSSTGSSWTGPREIHLLLAQIGASPARRSSLSMVLRANELPESGWSELRQLSWRVGAWGYRPAETGRRAHRAGYFVAVRSFEQKSTSRWLVVQVAPYVSTSDAEKAVGGMRSRLYSNSSSKVLVTAEREVEGIEVVGVTNPWTLEQLQEGKELAGDQKFVGPSATRYVAGNIENVLFFLQCSGLGEGWSWSDVESVASLQASKIQGHLERRKADHLSESGYDNLSEPAVRAPNGSAGFSYDWHRESPRRRSPLLRVSLFLGLLTVILALLPLLTTSNRGTSQSPGSSICPPIIGNLFSTGTVESFSTSTPVVVATLELGMTLTNEETNVLLGASGCGSGASQVGGQVSFFLGTPITKSERAAWVAQLVKNLRATGKFSNISVNSTNP